MVYLSRSQSAVNDSIQGSPKAIDDSTIATVACLANIETVPYFAHTIPRYPSQLGELLPVNSLDQYRLVTKPAMEVITTFKHQIVLSDLLRALHELTTFLNSTNKRLLPEDASYPDRVYEVEHAIAVSLYDDFIIADNDEHVEIGMLLLQAAYLFIYSNLRETPVGGRIRETLLCRLRVLLSASDLERLSKNFTEEVLWVLMVGIAAAAATDRAEFLGDAKHVCLLNKIDTWAEVLQLLESMPALLHDCLAICADSWLECA
ncbi:hypothetical protein LIA77_11263 [Sarocladium implicatum]|nr:hypothetical protein LIA77_11263 [Sarocladium implicatum]